MTLARRLRGVLLTGLVATACAGEVPPRDGSDDAGAIDAPLTAADAPGGDARVSDAPLAAADARVIDARITDAGASCMFQGRTGTCINTTIMSCGGQLQPLLCPGPLNIVCCLPGDGGVAIAACDPAAMPIPDDGLGEAPGAGGCAAGMLRIGAGDGFCIDRYEAFLEVSDGAGGFTAWSPYFNPGARVTRARSAAGAVPQGYVSGVQAAQACAGAGKRLCTNEEWLRACRGPSGTTYPYGDERQTGVCNDHRALHPAVELFGSVTNLTSPCLDQLHDSVDRTGARSGCVTAEGAFDMMGNLHEWTSDAAGTVRGGFYVDTVLNGDGCLYLTTAHDTGYYDYSTGFRCCAG